MIYAEIEEYKLNGEVQNLPGFKLGHKNIVDFILKITEEIWEEKNIDYIYDTYEKDIVIHSGARVINGVDEVIKGTYNTLKSFPDRKMGGETVVWSVDENGNFYSSHRIGSNATNLGSTVYGEATGKKIFFRTIADCHISENKIFEEWLVRDNLHLVKQLGFDPVEMAKRDGRYKDYPIDISPNGTDILQEERALNVSKANDLVISLFKEVWKKRDFKNLDQYYADSAILYAICEEDVTTKSGLQNYFENLISCFPQAEISLERISSNKKGNGYEVAARWKMKGEHKGQGFFGVPSGKSVSLPIISHYFVQDGKIAKEWLVFDGFDALCQIHS